MSTTGARVRVLAFLGCFALALPLLGVTSGAAASDAAATAGVRAAPATGTKPVPGPVAVAPRPQPGTATHFLDHPSYLRGVNDAGWYAGNIPFVDLPDKTIQDVYYYRWRVWKEHLRFTNPTDGWILTEFLDCCGYAAPYQGINAAAGHQIDEGRWVRNRDYLDDYIRFWLTGPGAGPKPATDGVNKDTTDWAHEYSFWLASAAYQRAQVTGDFSELTALLPQLTKQYRGWDRQFNAQLGLYWSVPVWDAMELSASSYESSDPYHGGAGYRPTINAYQYGDAVAIARIAGEAGDTATAAEYSRRAAGLKAAMQTWLWDPARKSYLDMPRDDNPAHQLLDTREEIGYVPWQFGAAATGDSAAWAQLLDPQGFAAPYGPTTAERRSPLFMYQAGGCCRWNGPSWPFATAQTLTGLANQLDDHPAQTTITRDDYVAELATYARTQFKDGHPYVAEAHNPDNSSWIYDGYNHSEDYNHSTFNDLVLSGLLGLRPQSGATLRLQPLVPASWDHYAVENAPYHGHDVTVLWDRDGTHYGQGTGMHVYLDGRLVSSKVTVGDLTIAVPPVPVSGAVAGVPAPPRQVNDAANPLKQGFPKPITSYTWRSDDPWNALDGKVWFDEVPENTRWTNYSSPNAQDWYGVDFGVPTPVSHVRWYGYSDGGGVRPAAAYRVQHLTADGWADVPGQTRDPGVPAGNAPNDITFPTTTTTQLRLVFTNPPGAFVGVTELQSWSASSRDAAVSVGPGTSTGSGVVSVQGATSVTVTVADTTAAELTSATVALSLPAGWAAMLDRAPADGTVPPGSPRQWVFTVTPPPDAAPGTITDVVATANHVSAGQASSTHTRQALTIAYPPGQTEPVGTWAMDEGSGSTAHDSSGSPQDLTLQGGTTWVPGESGSALGFDGTSQYAQTAGPVVDTQGAFTVAAWVRLDSTGRFATAVSQDGPTTSGFFLQYSAADGRFAFATGEGRALAAQAPVTGRWYHLVGVHDANAGTYTLYVDGQAQPTVWHQSTGDAAGGALAVGRGFAQSHPGDLWPGTVDQVRVWNRVLSAADVSTLYASAG